MTTLEISSIKESNSTVHNISDELNHLLLGIWSSIDASHSHASQTQSWDFQSFSNPQASSLEQSEADDDAHHETPLQ